MIYICILYLKYLETYLETLHSHFQPNCHFKMFKNSGSAIILIDHDVQQEQILSLFVGQTLTVTGFGCHKGNISKILSQTKRLNTQSGGPVRLLIFCSISIFLLASLLQEAKYVEGWPSTTSARPGWSRFDIPVDRYPGVHSLLRCPSRTLGSYTCP
jgi:hypothetical protein